MLVYSLWNGDLLDCSKCCLGNWSVTQLVCSLHEEDVLVRTMYCVCLPCPPTDAERLFRCLQEGDTLDCKGPIPKLPYQANMKKHIGMVRDQRSEKHPAQPQRGNSLQGSAAAQPGCCRCQGSSAWGRAGQPSRCCCRHRLPSGRDMSGAPGLGWWLCAKHQLQGVCNFATAAGVAPVPSKTLLTLMQD